MIRTWYMRALRMRKGAHAGSWMVIPIRSGLESMGPYDSKREAEADRVAVERTLRHEHERGFVTSEEVKS